MLIVCPACFKKTTSSGGVCDHCGAALANTAGGPQDAHHLMEGAQTRLGARLIGCAIALALGVIWLIVKAFTDR